MAAFSQQENEEFRSLLHTWYRRNCRPLPWRQSPSLYKTVLSEFMLQQTQVKTVLPYFESFLNRFPSFEALAKAPEEAVLEAWAGLGYYSRARNLHKLAQALVALKSLPVDPESWEKLPGVGPYTAAAVTSIAFGYPKAVVDGNVVRVLARISAEEALFKDNGAAVKHFGALAQTLLDQKDANTHNQAMMELGATVCMPNNPLCTVCPVVRLCQAAKLGIVDQLPKLMRTKPVQKRVNRVLLTSSSGSLLLVKRSAAEKRLPNFYELPQLEALSTLKENALLLWKEKKRSISNERITEVLFTGGIEEHYKGGADWHWVPWERVQTLALTGPHKRWIQEFFNEYLQFTST